MADEIFLREDDYEDISLLLFVGQIPAKE